MNEDIIGLSEGAALAGVSRDTLKRWIRAGRVEGRPTPYGLTVLRRSVEAIREARAQRELVSA